ncbi:VIT1/CCC1 transporter family protein [Candidatus Gottesmanbacteria bacterium]|nr:VIT1/CCC1 transporter family protein [Candidatus Gottesmanbacteria bacterium]
MKKIRLRNASYVRNFVFGVEDSLVSTVGLLSGIAVGGVARNDIVLTGIILLLVEAFSMAIGSLLSEQSAEEYLQRREVPPLALVANSLIMFFSYFCSGLLTLFPYFFSEPHAALPFSVGIALLALFGLGAINARLFKIRLFKNGIRTMMIGGFAILVGVTASVLLTR